MEFNFERKINYYETDKMGIVHHSNYIRFLEEARCKLLETVNLPYDLLEEHGVMIPVLNVNCDYKYHVTFGDTIAINLKIIKFTGAQMVVNYTITNKENKTICSIAETKHCFTDSNLKPINLRKFYPEAFEILKNISY